jgi:hypothetical protein
MREFADRSNVALDVVRTPFPWTVALIAIAFISYEFSCSCGAGGLDAHRVRPNAGRNVGDFKFRHGGRS